MFRSFTLQCARVGCEVTSLQVSGKPISNRQKLRHYQPSIKVSLKKATGSKWPLSTCFWRVEYRERAANIELSDILRHFPHKTCQPINSNQQVHRQGNSLNVWRFNICERVAIIESSPVWHSSGVINRLYANMRDIRYMCGLISGPWGNSIKYSFNYLPR